MRSALLKDLKARGLVVDVTHPDEFDRHLDSESRGLYCGFDPTADSLHVGSLLPLLALRRFQLAGHRPIVLIGGGTGLIGDPAGKTTERGLNPADQVAEWAERLKRQVAPFLDFDAGPHAARLLDNYAWLSRLNVIPFLREVGKEFSVGAMLGKESVRARMGRADTGLSYTEFTYQILQAYDFLTLCREHRCTIQIGGSDQWGNITAGIELIRRMQGVTAYGLTLPLVTKADGSKFGKSETGTVWLDPARTSPYEMYQFWLNTADADVITYLKYFTFLPTDAIAELAAVTARAPERRAAQRALAGEVTALVHGRERLTEAERITEALFGGDVRSLTQDQLAQAVRGMPRTELTGTDALPLTDLLVKVGLAESKKRSRELITAGAIFLNGQRVTRADPTVSRAAALHGKYLFLRKGKRTYHAVTFT